MRTAHQLFMSSIYLHFLTIERRISRKMSLRHKVLNLAMAIKNHSHVNRRFYHKCTERGKLSSSKVTITLPYSSDSPAKCWQCNYPRKSEYFCQKCKALQELPKDLNYFDIIGIEETYDVKDKDLHNKYRALQNILHPDRFSNRTEREKKISEDVSSMINKAYNTLSHPLERGLYMLKLKNLFIPEGTTSLEPEFLMEIMELNERVQEASEDKEKISKLIEENNSLLNRLSEEVSDAFKKSDMERGKLILIRMKYYASLQSRLKKIKQDLGIVD